MAVTLREVVERLQVYGGWDVTLSEYAPRGKYMTVGPHTIVMHPVDWLQLQHPDWSESQAVLSWLHKKIDRRVDAILARLDREMEQTCTCFWTDPKTWFTYYGAVEPGSQREQNPDCPLHGTEASR